MKIYLYIWMVLSLVNLVLLIRDRYAFGLLKRSYYKFLFKPWKIVTFIMAGAAMTFAAPYSGDYTWDYADASVMSVLTFITAPWTTGTLYRFYKQKISLTHAYVAFCTAMFSFSWFYDGYILLRDGLYPPTWYYNIVLSSILYFSAGALWSLETPPGQKAGFAFQRDTWPDLDVTSDIGKVLWFALPLVLLGGGIIVIFVINYACRIFR